MANTPAFASGVAMAVDIALFAPVFDTNFAIGVAAFPAASPNPCMYIPLTNPSAAPFIPFQNVLLSSSVLSLASPATAPSAVNTFVNPDFTPSSITPNAFGTAFCNQGSASFVIFVPYLVNTPATLSCNAFGPIASAAASSGTIPTIPFVTSLTRLVSPYFSSFSLIYLTASLIPSDA